MRSPSRATSARDLVTLALAAGLLFSLWSGARDLWNPNEPLYGQAVVEMASRGDWLVPTVNGLTFDEKPILYYWLALAAAGLLGGVSELTLRLPSIASGVALVLLTYVLVRPYSSRRRAWLAATLVATTYIVFWSSRQVQMDLLLAACTLGAVVAATRVLDHGMSPVAGWALAGAASGLGFLAKGPVGLICPGLTVLLYAMATRRLRRLWTPALLAAVPCFLVIAAPWYLALLWRGEAAFLTELLVRQNFQRFVEPWDHQAPWWYFLVYFWLDMLPWSLFLPLAWGLAPRDENERRLNRLAWIWVVGLIAFFSLSASKRSPYILPVAPALAILVSAVADRWWSGSLGRGRLRAAWAILGAIGALLVAAGIYLGAFATDYRPEDTVLTRAGLAAAGLIVAGGLAVLAGLMAPWRGRFGAATALVAFVTVLYLFAAARVLPAVNPYKSHRGMCEAIKARVPPERPLRGFHVWKWRASYSYYTGRPIPPLSDLEDLRSYWDGPGEVFLIVEQSRLAEARTILGDIEPLVFHRIGHNAAYLFSNRPSSDPSWPTFKADARRRLA